MQTEETNESYDTMEQKLRANIAMFQRENWIYNKALDLIDEKYGSEFGGIARDVIEQAEELYDKMKGGEC